MENRFESAYDALKSAQYRMDDDALDVDEERFRRYLIQLCAEVAEDYRSEVE